VLSTYGTFAGLEWEGFEQAAKVADHRASWHIDGGRSAQGFPSLEILELIEPVGVALTRFFVGVPTKVYEATPP